MEKRSLEFCRALALLAPRVIQTPRRNTSPHLDHGSTGGACHPERSRGTVGIVPPKIFVTQPLLGNAIERLRAVGTVEVNPDSRAILPKAKLIEAVRDCEILCCLLHDRIDADVIDAATSLVMISDGAINPTNINVARAEERGIAVANIPNIVAEATADMQWALLLAVARRVVEADRALRGGLFPGGQSTALRRRDRSRQDVRLDRLRRHRALQREARARLRDARALLEAAPALAGR